MLDKFSTNSYFEKMDEYFRAANYLSVAQLYLLNNPLLSSPLKKQDLKPRVVGHFGTVPGQNFVYLHCNRAIIKHNLNMMLISGPGHGGNFFISNSYLEGYYSEVYPEITQDEEGLKKLCKQFSFPGGVSSHASPEVPGSIHEGGELGYSLAHAFGAILDNPDLIVTTIVGDGEAETGALATSWHLNKFINPAKDGFVLPVLHLNGYKISSPTILARISNNELLSLFKGYGYQPIIVEGHNSKALHKTMAKAMDACIEKFKAIRKSAKHGKFCRPLYPMIILKTPKGWTAPKVVEGKKVEGTFRAHQVPVDTSKPQNMEVVEKWLRSYRPQELFVNGKLRADLRELAPKGEKRISANPNANGGLLLKKLVFPSIKDFAIKQNVRGETNAQNTGVLGQFLAQVYKLNANNFRIFGPDEALSNRLGAVFDAQARSFDAKIVSGDEFLSNDGRVFDSFLSEHVCEGLLEGYVLTGRHGIFHSYEAFVRVVDSMVSQHIKWIKMCKELSWRKEISSLNILLTSGVWQQDHNGFTHQDPGFIDHIMNKREEIVRAYFPADANTLLETAKLCLSSKNCVNAIVASKHPTPQWLSEKEAKIHVENGLSIWDWACTGNLNKPDVIIASAGVIPTIEALACVQILNGYLPELSIRFVNVNDLMKLTSNSRHFLGLDDSTYNQIFTKDKPIIFNYHGYPSLIHELTYKRENQNLHVRGYVEEGTITTPFDMRVLNKIDRFNLVLSVLKHINIPAAKKGKIKRDMEEKLEQHKKYIKEFGIDLPEILDWKWRGVK